VTGGGEGGSVGERGRGQRRAAHCAERQRREQAHGAHDDQRAGVPEQMGEIEPRRGRHRRTGVAGAQEIEQRVQAIGIERAGGHRGAQILVGKLHQEHPPAATVGCVRRPDGSICAPSHGTAAG
jgi:hypothetical protein